ncbi:polymorphic toxin-type HINT domain-containing protein, partial [Streptomyces sp. NPDC091212]|uniref:polymorphic toxin-type HINT domain-containing protein n=1 Tax=Streptomyces sp. NPDC091212 TaxID=3155191 RepID=UPI0034466028
SAQAKARQIIELARKAAEAAKRLKAAKEKARKAAQAKKAKAAAAAQALRAKVARAKAPTGKPVQKQARVNLTKSSGGGGAAKTASLARTNNATRTNSPSSGGGGGGGGGGASHGETVKTGCNSFVPGTLVLMADGTTKPIEDIKNGDKVLATDPVTGETSVETVSAEITGQGLKNLVEVTIATEDDTETGKNTTEAPTEATSTTSTVTATDGHPFWVPALNTWIDATDLKTGQWLQTSTGTHIQITAIKRWTAPAETVHNLTVTNHHTYYVLAGSAPVLVHNCNTEPVSPAFEGDPYHPDEAQKRIDAGRQAWAQIPREVHNTVNGI